MFLSLTALGADARAEAPLDRLLSAVAEYTDLPPGLHAELARHCETANLQCAAEVIANRLNPPARLVSVQHPDTDSIRRVHTVPSVTAIASDADGTLVLELSRFNRKADQEIIDALTDANIAEPPRLVLDLRANKGGDFDRMRRVASLFTGTKPDVVHLIGRERTTAISLPEPLRAIEVAALDVLIGPETASSAEVLAALLRHHANARLIGARTRGKDYLSRLIPVDHDWRMLVPAERIEVPGETLAGGLVPDVDAAGPMSPEP